MKTDGPGNVTVKRVYSNGFITITHDWRSVADAAQNIGREYFVPGSNTDVMTLVSVEEVRI